MEGANVDAHGAMQQTERWAELGQQLRVDSVRAAAAAGSGHPTSSMSAADLMAVLLDGHLRYDFEDPANPCNDHLIFSTGHASPLLYSLYHAAGAIGEQELLSFRKLGSRLEGHPTPRLPCVDLATGSLGRGLPVGVGVAIDQAYQEAVSTAGRPTAIVARTVKGKGVKAVENRNGMHGKPLDDPEGAIRELGGVRDLTVEVRRPPNLVPNRFSTL